MITKQEVIDNYKEYETFADDRFGKRFANYCYADELEKIGFGLQCSEEEWNKDVKDFTKKNIIKELVEDAEFGYEKSMDNRGISTSLMSSVCESWVKILEDEDLIGLEMTALFVNILEKYGGKKAYKLMTEEELIIELEDLSDENEELKKKLENIREEVIRVDFFSDEEINHDIIAYLDSKDCYNIVCAIKKIKRECFR